MAERLLCIYLDNDTEFIKQDVTQCLTKNGIMHQRTIPYSPQQNGVVDRMNRFIMDKARNMLRYKGVQMEWWTQAENTAAYLNNRPTTAHNTNVTPYELGFVKRILRLSIYACLDCMVSLISSRSKGLNWRPKV